jgi:uncharacterized protein YbaA (DUF1428 family)
MTYVEGFVAAVPTANKDEYLKHAKEAWGLIREGGVVRMVESWGDDVPKGTTTDFYGAVQARDDETVVFSWFEYPDKAARDAANAKMMADPRMEEMSKSMPFDGKRMIYGGFDAFVDERAEGRAGPSTTLGAGYVDGYILPVPAAKRDAYAAMAREMAGKFRDWGALRVVEAWGDDVPDGKVTDYKRAVKAADGEGVVYSYVEWPDKAARDAAWAKMMADESMKDQEMPFDGKRMFWGGFQPILDLTPERADV